MRNSNRRDVDRALFAEMELPEGYEVRNVRFQVNDVYYNGEFVERCSLRRYAVNFAVRDSLRRNA